MTDVEIQELSGDALNIAVARAIGWTIQPVVNQFGKTWYLPTNPRGKMYPGETTEADAWRLVPEYSKSPDAVFRLLDEIETRREWECHLDISPRHGVTARIITNPSAYPAEPIDYIGFGITLGEALCRAFLFTDKGEKNDRDRA